MEECVHKENHSNGMGNGEFKVAVSATLHCLTGCAVGEILGLIIGVGLGLSVVGIVVLATTLAYVSGFTLGLLPLVRRRMTLRRALKTIWVGEVISIAVRRHDCRFGLQPSILVWNGRCVACRISRCLTCQLYHD